VGSIPRGHYPGQQSVDRRHRRERVPAGLARDRTVRPLQERADQDLEGWLIRTNFAKEVEPYPVRDTSWVREGPLRSLVGNLAANSLAQSSPFGPLVSYRGVVEAFNNGDLNWQSRQLLPAILDGEITQLANLHLLGIGGAPALLGRDPSRRDRGRAATSDRVSSSRCRRKSLARFWCRCTTKPSFTT